MLLQAKTPEESSFLELMRYISTHDVGISHINFLSSEILKHQSTYKDLDIVEISAKAKLPNGNEVFLNTTGKGDCMLRRTISALMEINERIAVFEAKADIYDSYENLKHEAVHPSKMTLAPRCHYEEHSCIHWSTATSTWDGRKVLIPRPERGCSSPLFHHTTNGAAAGNGQKDAINRGLLELLERDAFLTSWFAKRLASPIEKPWPISLKEYSDWLAFWGFSITLHQLQSDYSLPIILAIANQRHSDAVIPYSGIIIGCAGAYDIESAAESAVNEVIQTVEVLLNIGLNPCDSLPPWMREYAVTEISHDLTFLSKKPAISFHSQDSGQLTFRGLINSLKVSGIEVFFIDRTPTYLEKRGLSIIEVIAPGLQPLVLGVSPLDQRVAMNRFTSEEISFVSFRPHPLG